MTCVMCGSVLSGNPTIGSNANRMGVQEHEYKCGLCGEAVTVEVAVAQYDGGALQTWPTGKPHLAKPTEQ